MRMFFDCSVQPISMACNGVCTDHPVGNDKLGMSVISTFPRFSIVNKRLSNASGRGVPKSDSRMSSTSRTSMTSSGMSTSQVCDGSVCDIAVSVTVRGVPAAVET